MSARILCVDDEQNVLDAHRRGLRKHFQIETALGGEQALGMLDAIREYGQLIRPAVSGQPVELIGA